MFDLLRQFKRWQAKEYAPDWDAPWNGDLFRFRSADGTSTSSIEVNDNFVRLQEDGATVYQRLRNANHIETPFFVEGWPAYDDAALWGLDPTVEYWLTHEASRPEPQLHLMKLPDNYKIGSGTLMGRRYGYVELESVAKTWFDFIAGFVSAKPGTLYNGKDYALVNGAQATVGRAAAGGEERSGVIIEIPPLMNNINGATFLDYQVAVPVFPHVRLDFEAGIADSSGVSDGALMGIQINGTTQWRETVLPGAWKQGSIDLTAHAGTTITVRFLSNAGAMQDPRFDVASWANPHLVMDSDIADATLPMGLPSNGKLLGGSDNVTVGEAANGVVPVRTPLPAKFAVFLQEPPAVGIGNSLLDFPYDVWKSADGGLPYLFSTERSGTIEEARSGGVTLAKTLVAVPPRDGNTIITTAVTISENANALSVNYGLADPAADASPNFEYSGVSFSILMNGKEVLSDAIRTAGWRGLRIPLNDYRGKRVLIQLRTNAQQNSLYDWARWSDLRVE